MARPSGIYCCGKNPCGCGTPRGGPPPMRVPVVGPDAGPIIAPVEPDPPLGPWEPEKAPIALPLRVRRWEDLELVGLAPWLVSSLWDALERSPVDWYVTSGRRTAAQQRRLIAEGKTTTPPECSTHVIGPGRLYATGIDLAPVSGGYAELARLAADLVPEWRWGGTFRVPSINHFDSGARC